MSDSPVHFVHPEFMHALWIWACAVFVLVLLERRGHGALDRLVSPALQDRLVERPSRWRRWARVALLGLAGFAMIVALMQPQWGSRFVATPRVGAEIMIALDVSRSMLADDAKPSRLERAKAEISDLLSYLDEDYVGLIAFAGRATVLSPMTPDKSFLRLALDRAGPHVVSRGGTNLAEPILRAVAGMGEPGPAQRALILITDGEDHDSFAIDAAKTAAEAGIKIIAIGFGDEAGSQIYLRDPKTGARSLLRDGAGRTVVSRLDGELLREIALATDGAFVPAGTGVLDLASIYDAHISPLTRGQLDERGRTIRDEAFQFLVLLAIICLVAAASIASASGSRRTRRTRRDTRASRVVPLVMAIMFLSTSAPPVRAQSETAAAAPEGSAPDDASTAEEASATKEDSRSTFNRGNEKLRTGDPIAAAALLRAARRDATDDVLLRYAATYNLGVAAIARADGLEAENPPEALAALYEAADWFREAAVARPDESDPRHNLDVTLRRALILSDEISRENAKELDVELDTMIEGQRQRVAQTAGLLEAVVRVGELGAAEELRPAFRDSATQQRLVLADANALGERVAREREQLMALAEEERSPEDILEAAQLEAVLIHLDSAIERMGQTRRQLRQRRAERAYRRGSSALGDLKRARDQLRDLAPQIDILLAEVGQLANSTSALANAGLLRDPAVGTTQPTALPAFLTRESVEADSEQVEARVTELATRLALAAEQALQASASASPPGGAPPGSPDQQAQAIAFQAAAPLVATAASAMDRVTASIGAGNYDGALFDEVKAGEALAAAREHFLDLRQLLNVTHSDEEQIARLASSDDPALAQEREEVVVGLAEIQSRNSQRVLRLEKLLERERNARIATLEAEATPDATAPEEPDLDPVEQERRRFELAEQLLELASEGMAETTDALGQADAERAPDWPRVSEAATRATEHLDAIRTLFFSIAEHVRKLARDQIDVRDRTQDVIALSVTESAPTGEAKTPELSESAASSVATDAPESMSVSEPEPEPESEPQPAPRGPETLIRSRALAGEQQKLEARGGELADALFVQAEEMGQGATEDAPPDADAERDRIRRAAEHIALAQLAMVEANESLEAETAPLAPAQDAQALAVDELNSALGLLSPPPPPEQGDSKQDESQSDDDGSQENDEEGEEEEQGEGGAEARSEDADEESMDDPSQLLQGVRDRDAERRRERDREEQRRRTEPVDKDW
jgi:Ca-activated chloride channel family protein